MGTVASGTSASIAAIPEADPSKKWFNLRYDLLASGRDYSQLTAPEEAMVEAEALQQTKSGAHAKAIMEMAYGIQAKPHIEIIDRERNEKQSQVARPSSELSIGPNPAQETAQIFFTVPETQHISWLTLADLSGHIYRQIDLADTFGESQITLSTHDLPAGLYLVRLEQKGKPSEVKKLTVIR